VIETHADSAMTLISAQPVNQEEAVNLLNAALKRINCYAIRAGRTLTIVDKNEAKTSNIPVNTGNDPASISKTDEIVTWIIHVGFVEAGSLLKDLSSFVSSQATVVANEAGNAIVVTDTQSNIRHLAKIIQAVDNSAETETEIRVFHLKFANPQGETEATNRSILELCAAAPTIPKGFHRKQDYWPGR
jgi:type II secretory pathway component GspD/PulD (secretin)